MRIIYSDELRHKRAQALIDQLGTDAEIRLYELADTEPNLETDTLLVTCLCSTPIGADVDGVLTFDAIAPGTVIASGNADYAAIHETDGTQQIVGLEVTDQDGDGPVILAQTGTTLTMGDTLTISSLIITQGNGAA